MTAPTQVKPRVNIAGMKTTLSQTDMLLPVEKRELLLWMLTEAKRRTR